MAASADSPQTIALLLQKSAQINMKVQACQFRIGSAFCAVLLQAERKSISLKDRIAMLFDSCCSHLLQDAQDTLGRTALMFAAGNNAKAALLALMDAGGQQALSLQDNRGNNVLKYALDDSEVKQLLETRYEFWFIACFHDPLHPLYLLCLAMGQKLDSVLDTWARLPHYYCQLNLIADHCSWNLLSICIEEAW